MSPRENKNTDHIHDTMIVMSASSESETDMASTANLFKRSAQNDHRRRYRAILSLVSTMTLIATAIAVISVTVKKISSNKKNGNGSSSSSSSNNIDLGENDVESLFTKPPIFTTIDVSGPSALPPPGGVTRKPTSKFGGSGADGDGSDNTSDNNNNNDQPSFFSAFDTPPISSSTIHRPTTAPSMAPVITTLAPVSKLNDMERPSLGDLTNPPLPPTRKPTRQPRPTREPTPAPTLKVIPATNPPLSKAPFSPFLDIVRPGTEPSVAPARENGDGDTTTDDDIAEFENVDDATGVPSEAPFTLKPTRRPRRTGRPTEGPTEATTDDDDDTNEEEEVLETQSPTEQPVRTRRPSDAPVATTAEPAVEPTEAPTFEPTEKPVIVLRERPTNNPTNTPVAETDEPTFSPSGGPTLNPTGGPTFNPTATDKPVDSPTTDKPTPAPVVDATNKPTLRPSANPTRSPTTREPTAGPSTLNPTDLPSRMPITATTPNDDRTDEAVIIDTNDANPETTTTTAVNDADVTYRPGDLDHMESGLLLSRGLTAKIIATSGRKVTTNSNGNVGASDLVFHSRPDAGGTFPDTSNSNEGGWRYLSNSEMRPEDPPGGNQNGGVGAITFDKYGDIIGYEMALSKTTWNCGGGYTPWNTWVSCEEAPAGVIWQVDPMGEREPQQMTMGSYGGRWESFTYDISDMNAPRYFVTEDHVRGALIRFTPAPSEIDWQKPWGMLHGNGTTDYLHLTPNGDGTGGTYKWIPERGRGRENAALHYPNCEGIDSNGEVVYFVSKKLQALFELSLRDNTYVVESTVRGLMDGRPDQVARILTTGNGEHFVDDILYFTEEGGVDAGVHGRDSDGNFFTILESPIYKDETSGLAFSPNAKHMYIAFQENGILLDVTRLDGLTFHATTLNVKYHAK